ncbi:helix-turn-helix transcriptional regulator [Paenibacillus sp. GP183]|uniref:helix-turn-helix transcriptional regulator n=1 Tax=Paenibacillus sp. GP183 TaxID=1882751 RepID=UPI000896942D|nr:helix-turn-helix transcriptional regulator [Paenibacillus sp. GP183]SEC60166.1 Helix-turn-helix domain-containing protein [Paenibacillus sp. GP183]
MAVENSKAKTMGAFLKSRRERLQPEEVGFSHSYGQRRTPGLRREEIAMLAGVSTTYYTWLEQGREVTASKEIIENIAKALQLTPDESVHLFQLWNPNEPTVIHSVPSVLHSQWHNIIGQLSYPSYITNERSEVLAWNQAANETLADFTSMPGADRILIRLLFTDPEMRRRMINWEEFARSSVAVFRTYYDKYKGDPWFEETVEQLLESSMEFGTIWRLYDIQLKKVSRVFLQLPGTAKPVPFDINSLSSLSDNQDLYVCIYTPVTADGIKSP